MIKLFTEEEYSNSKSMDLLLLKCEFCSSKFHREKKGITRVINGKNPNFARFCSMSCKTNSLIQERYKEFKLMENGKYLWDKVICNTCNKDFLKLKNQIRKTKNNFCSKSCAATYNNTHKTKGTRRSKLEIYLENKLVEIYPNLQIDFNKKDTINSELDIYIPSLKLAFELNGIYHYEPIHGIKKFKQIQLNDIKKEINCKNSNIKLVTINVSEIIYFKTNYAIKFLKIIQEEINSGETRN